MTTLHEGITTASTEDDAKLSGAARTVSAGENSGVLSATEAAKRRSLDERLLQRLLSFLGDPPLAFELWNGRAVGPAGNEPIGRIRLADRQTLLALLRDPQMRFGDAYSRARSTSREISRTCSMPFIAPAPRLAHVAH